MGPAVVQVYFQWKRRNSPTLFSWTDVSVSAATVAFPFSVRIFLATPLQLMVRWNLWGFFMSDAPRVGLYLPTFYTCAVKMSCINESICLLHSISFGFDSLLMQVECFTHPHSVILQRVSFHPVMSLSYWVSFVSMPLYKLWLETRGITASRASAFRGFFTRKHYLSWGSLKLGTELMILKIFISMDDKIEATRLWVNDDSAPYSAHLFCPFSTTWQYPIELVLKYTVVFWTLMYILFYPRLLTSFKFTKTVLKLTRVVLGSLV